MKIKKPSLQERFDNLLRSANEFVSKVENRKVKHSYIFELPPKDNPGGKISIIKVDELFAHVRTAQDLGYEVLLSARDGKLTVSFVEKLIPLYFGC